MESNIPPPPPMGGDDEYDPAKDPELLERAKEFARLKQKEEEVSTQRILNIPQEFTIRNKVYHFTSRPPGYATLIQNELVKLGINAMFLAKAFSETESVEGAVDEIVIALANAADEGDRIKARIGQLLLQVPRWPRAPLPNEFDLPEEDAIWFMPLTSLATMILAFYARDIVMFGRTIKKALALLQDHLGQGPL